MKNYYLCGKNLLYLSNEFNVNSLNELFSDDSDRKNYQVLFFFLDAFLPSLISIQLIAVYYPGYLRLPISII